MWIDALGRRTDSLQMLQMITVGSRAGSQALGEVCHCLGNVFLWQLFPDDLRDDFYRAACNADAV